MRIDIRVAGDDLISLTKWLRSQRPLQGRVEPVSRPPAPRISAERSNCSASWWDRAAWGWSWPAP